MKKKAVVKLVMNNADSKKAAKKAIVEVDGFTSLTLDIEKSTLTVIGGTDPTKLVRKLRDFVIADLEMYGPEKDEGKPHKPDFVEKTTVVKIVVNDARSKKAAKQAIEELDGFTSLTLDFEKSTMVVIGDTDPTSLVMKLRNFVRADLLMLLPEKDEGKSQKNNGGDGNVDQQQPQKNHGGGGNVDQQQPRKNHGGGGNVDQQQPQKNHGRGGNVDQQRQWPPQHRSSSPTIEHIMVMVIIIIIYHLFWR